MNSSITNEKRALSCKVLECQDFHEERVSRGVGLTLFYRLQARRQSVATALSFAVTILGKWQVATGDYDRLYGGTELVSTMIFFTLDISINKG